MLETCSTCGRGYLGSEDHHAEVFHTSDTPTLDELWNGPMGRQAWAQAGARRRP